VTPTKQPPVGGGWLHEIKYDRHRLLAIMPGCRQLSLASRNGYDRTQLFRGPFAKLAAIGHPIVPDGKSRFLTSAALRTSIG